MASNMRPIQFLDYLPEVFQGDLGGAPQGILGLTFQSAVGTTLTVGRFNTGDVGFPQGTPVTVPNKGLRTALKQPIPARSTGLTQIEVQDGSFLAALQLGDTLEVHTVSFFTRFLKPFETLFEELEAAIEGTPGGLLPLTFQSAAGTKLTVAPFNTGAVGFPPGTPVTVPDRNLRTTLKQAIPANGAVLTQIDVQDSAIAAALRPGDMLEAQAGGIPDLFSPNTTPAPQFTQRPKPSADNPDPDFDFLNYLASWIALPLRAGLIRHGGETDAEYVARRMGWNRQFFRIAIQHSGQRGTLPGMDALLRAWLKNELLETEPPLLILTDLTRTHTDMDAVLQFGVTATLGVDTVLGEGPPFLFIADLVADPALPKLRNPVGLDVFQKAARFLLDGEKPAHTYYQLRVRAHTMQLPEAGQTAIHGQPGAQIGETTLLWDEPWIFNSDC